MTKNIGAIAILGGMGPQASAKMLEVMVSMAARNFGIKEDADFPEIIVDSVPVPNFISNRKNLDKARDILSSRVKILQNFKPSFFAIACNTAHILLPDLQFQTKVPFVSMIEEVASEVSRSGIKQVGLLCTPVTSKSGLYRKALAMRGIRVIVPSKSEQRVVESVIRNVLVGKADISDEQAIIAVANSLVEKGAQGIILGCTELPLIFPGDFDLQVFDSIEITARVLLTKGFGRKN